MNKIVLFCFPYAGGSAVVFNSWKKFLHPSIELRPVELRGRGRRIAEKMYSDTTEMIDDVFHTIKHSITGFEYALFGHSMGALIAYELTQKIRNEGLPLPKHVFFSGKGAPHIKRSNEKVYHLMGEEQFEEEVLKLGGTPPEFFENPELMNFFLPLLKNDFRLSETGIESESIHPLDQDITVFLGKEDDFSKDQCEQWHLHTNRQCHMHYFEGGHFFLHDNAREIVQIISAQLNQ